MKQGTLGRIGWLVAAWLPALFLAFVFSMQGTAKFSDTSGWASAFRHWGYPVWFRWTVGVVEVAAALLLVLGRRTARYGAVLVILVMAGAMATHVVQDGGRHMTSEVMPMTLASIVLLIRWRMSKRAAVDQA